MSYFTEDYCKNLFSLGALLATPAALRLLEERGVSLLEIIGRHHVGDWGDVCPDDAVLNDDALRDGDRLVSAYKVGDEKVFVITEADRSQTTLMLAEEY
jgi:hypothetical protein